MKRIIVLAAFAALLGAAPATDPALLSPTKAAAIAPSHYGVSFKTTAGTFVVAVTRSWSPHGADRFYALVKHGFYDGTAFFRVVPGFVVQFGLSPNPKVNAAWTDAHISDDKVAQSNHAGYLSFASAGPGTRTTQVFVNLADNARLDAMGFSPFGKVASGMSVVRHIYAGYGESPDQGEITSSGSAYLQKSFPKLDRILSAKIVPAPH